jgi:hypothetical protein
MPMQVVADGVQGQERAELHESHLQAAVIGARRQSSVTDTLTCAMKEHMANQRRKYSFDPRCSRPRRTAGEGCGVWAS